MTQYINKDILIIQIEKLKKSLPWGSCASQISMECNCKNEAYNDVISLINSMKVKRVNLKKEIDEWLLLGNITDTRYDDYCDNDIIETAEHFFELGIKTQKEE